MSKSKFLYLYMTGKLSLLRDELRKSIDDSTPNNKWTNSSGVSDQFFTNQIKKHKHHSIIEQFKDQLIEEAV